MSAIPIGYGVIRTYKTKPRSGKSMCAYPHRLYPTRQAAAEALVLWDCSGYDGGVFDYDVVEVRLCG